LRISAEICRENSPIRATRIMTAMKSGMCCSLSFKYFTMTCVHQASTTMEKSEEAGPGIYLAAFQETAFVHPMPSRRKENQGDGDNFRRAPGTIGIG
jgi:hypothetical protein